MSDMLRRLERLPAHLTQGAWTACEVVVDQGRIRFSELADHADARRRDRRRRGLRWMGGGLGALLLAPAAPTPAVGASLAVVGLLAMLNGAEGVRGATRERHRKFELAVLDPIRDEVELLGPQGSLLFAPLSDVRMFLLVCDRGDQRFHVALVCQSGAFMPWLCSLSGSSAGTLTWLLGHLTDRPAMRLESPLAEAAERLDQAAPIDGPEPPEATATIY